MTFSDDEVEAVARSVTNYYLEDDRDEPISFSILPITWSDSESEIAHTLDKCILLHGITDTGERICKKVVSWKINFSCHRPEVLVLSKEKKWIKLEKPRKSFEDTIRTVMIAIHCLHFVRKQPEKSESLMWSYLEKEFSYFKVKPSKNDFVDHLPLMKAAVNHDKIFAKSRVMLTFFDDPKKKRVFDEDIHCDFAVKKTKLMTEGDQKVNEETGATNGNDSDHVQNMGEDICPLCDDGGELLCCDGVCLRSFHATVDSGFASGCKSLGLSEDQVKGARKFLCLNCQYNQHQCFACGKLGSSDRSSKNVEVFCCASVACGRFYHPGCVSELLHPINHLAAEQILKKIFAGESFSCPRHKCFECKQEEDKDVGELQFAICRRCPKVYHRKCLPRDIFFESIMNEGILKRAWDNLPPNRILIYCTKHELDVHTLVPKGEYIIFPNVQKGKEKGRPDIQPSQEKFCTTKINMDSRNHSKKDPLNRVKPVGKVSYSVKDNSTKVRPKQSYQERLASKRKSQLVDALRLHLQDSGKCTSLKVDNSSALGETNIHVKQASRERLGSSRKFQGVDESRLHLKDRVKCSSLKVNRFSTFDETSVPLEEDSLNQVLDKDLELVKSKKEAASCCTFKQSMRDVPATKNPKRRVVNLMKEKMSSSVSKEIVTDSSKEGSPQVYSSIDILDKAIPQENVAGEASIQKLEKHILDEPNINYQPEIYNLQAKLKIADKVLCYAHSGDTILNICCRNDDFSCLMRQKLEKDGRKCSVKNYDIFHQGVFDPEKEDWIPTDSRLIMGLIFPSGLEGGVNEFIDKLLNFKMPKLLLLLCPRGTTRLDEKQMRYNLLWEDLECFSCKAHLPGKMHLNENLEGDPPLLHLWSREDWTKMYKPIAVKHGHISNDQIDQRAENKSSCLFGAANQINDLPEKHSNGEELKSTREIICSEARDISVDKHVNIDSSTAGSSESQNVFYQNMLLFATGPFGNFSNSSCGWLIE